MVCHYTEWNYAEGHIFFSFMLSVIVLNVVMLNVVMLNVVMLSVGLPLQARLEPTQATNIRLEWK